MSLFNELEKTANETYVEKVERITPEERIGQLRVDLGDAKPIYLIDALKREGLLEYAQETGMLDDINAKGTATGAGALAGFAGAGIGLLSSPANSSAAKFAGRTAIGAGIGAGLGAGLGYLAGKHSENNPSDLHKLVHGGEEDVTYRAKSNAGSIGHNEAGFAQTANTQEVGEMSLLDELEKTARYGVVNKAKELGGVVTGRGVKDAKINHSRIWEGGRNDHLTVDQFADLDRSRRGAIQAATERQNAARRNVAIGAGGAGVAGVGAYGVANAYGDEEGDLEQTASTDLMDSLEKVAAKASFINNLTGRRVRESSKSLKNAKKIESNAGAEKGTISDAYKELRNKDVKDMVKAQGAVAGTAAAGVGIHSLTKTKDKEASEDLMDSLEKEAAGVLTALKGGVKGIKNFAGNVSGKNLKASNANVHKELAKVRDASEQVVASGGTTSAKKIVAERKLGEAKGIADAAKVDTTKARRQLAGGVGLTGAGAVVGNSMTNQDKTASEDFMSDLYKEAATAILDTASPTIQTYNDPIDRIKF